MTKPPATTATTSSPDPTIPLTPEARAAYEDLYSKYETAIEATADPGVLEALAASQVNVDNILTKDNMYRLHANTTLYDALLKQIDTTNDDLADLKKQIEAISSKVAVFGDIIAAISKVLSVVPIP